MATQQLIRDFDEKGVSGWHFAKDDIGFSLLVKLPKSAKSKVFLRNLWDNQVSTLPRELSDTDKMYYSEEQKEKDKSLAQLHTDFAPVL